MNIIVFWDVASCSFAVVDRRFRGALFVEVRTHL
jgi:hypothetical protein